MTPRGVLPAAQSRPSAARTLYRAVGEAAGLLTRLRRTVARGADRERLDGRLGSWAGHGEAADRPWMWVHSASAGEAEIALALAFALGPRLPGVRLVLTTMTATGLARLRQEQAVESHYFPIDCRPFLKRVLDPRPPLLFVSVETELWPALLALLAASGTPAAVASARISDRSLPRYRRGRSLFAPAAASLARVCARDAEEASRWQDIGADRAAIRVSGNIKFDLETIGTMGETVPLFAAGQGPPLLVGASTHEGEDAVVLEAFEACRAGGGRARLLLAPRHPERAAAVAAQARARGHDVQLFGSLEADEAAAAAGAAWPQGGDVVVLDRLGLLRRAYAAAAASFVGGSLVEGPGGHNLLEPVAEGCAVASGALLSNVRDQAAILRDHDALRTVADAASLAEFFSAVLASPDPFRASARSAAAAVRDGGGALASTVAELLTLLPSSIVLEADPESPGRADDEGPR